MAVSLFGLGLVKTSTFIVVESGGRTYLHTEEQIDKRE
jgi:hypothetical protein